MKRKKVRIYSIIIKLIFTFLVSLQFESYAQINSPKIKGSLYDDSMLPRIEITLAQADLDFILESGNESSDEEFPATFSFKSASKNEYEENVGFRLRGNTSRNAAKKSYKVSFNSFEKGRDLHGFEKLNLNGEHNDPTIIRSKLCWDLMNALNVPSSRSNHVELYINDEFFGVYINVEHIDEEFVEERFGNKGGNLYKCLWPADLKYHGASETFYKQSENGRRAYDLKTNEDEDDYSGLVNFITILNETPASSFEEAIQEVFDVETYLKALAVETLVAHWDNYGVNQNNYYLYDNPGDGKFYYIPYDLDNTLGIDWFDVNWAEWNVYQWYTDSRPLTKRIMEVKNFRNEFTTILNQLLQTGFSPDQLNPRIDEIKSLIQDAAERDLYRTYDYDWTIDDFNQSFSEPLENLHVRYGLKEFIIRRHQTAINQLDEIITLSTTPIENMMVYPNPAIDGFTISLPSEMLQHNLLKIYTLSGQMVLTQSLETSQTRIEKKLKPGMYLLQFENENSLQSFTQRLVIQQ